MGPQAFVTSPYTRKNTTAATTASQVPLRVGISIRWLPDLARTLFHLNCGLGAMEDSMLTLAISAL